MAMCRIRCMPGHQGRDKEEGKGHFSISQIFKKQKKTHAISTSISLSGISENFIFNKFVFCSCV